MIENLWQLDAFSMFELTNAINNIPTKPGRIMSMGLFAPTPISTTVAVLEEENGVLALVPNAERGSTPTIEEQGSRKIRAVNLMHLPVQGTVKADDVQNIRAFGTTTELEQIAEKVNQKIGKMRANIEVTREHALVTALSGSILDSDHSTVVANLFTLYGLTRGSVDFLLGTATTDVRGKCIELKRTMELALGGTGYAYPHIMCTDTFFDAFTSHATVIDAYRYWASNEMNRADVRAGFFYGGCLWENYDPKIGSTSFTLDGDGNAFPVGTVGVFEEYLGPADYSETVNTLGQEFYAKQEPLAFNKGTQIEAQSNPLPVCVKPDVLVRAYSSN